jgi:fibronectin-binding autotransporter adhesin
MAGSTLDMNTADAGTVSFTVAGTQTYNLGGLKGDRDLALGANSIDVGANNQSTTYAGDLSGTGGVGKVGTGTLTLSGTNSYSGGTTIAGGTLALGSADALGSSGTIAFNGGTLQFSAANTTDYSSRFSNAASQAYNLDTNGQNVTLASNLTSSGGTLVKTGAGTLTLSGTNSYSGGTTVSAGTLEGSATSLTGGITNNATVAFDQATAGTYAGVMSGTGDFIKTGAGALTLSGNNSYDGTTTVSAGTLLINGNQSAATGSLSVLSGATLGGSGTLGGSMSLASGSTLSPGNSPGTITSASGSWAGGANYNVQIVDAAGTSGTDWDLADFSGALDITATSGTPFLVNLWTLSSTGPDVDGNATNFSSNASYAWKIASAAGGVTGFTADKFTVNTSATNGTAGFANSFGSGQFAVANAGNDLNVVFTPAIVFDVASGQSETQTQQGANASIDSALSVTKTGAGTVVMNGTNTYSAATSVNAGTMEVTGSITNSAVTVNNGGTLAGTGSILQFATINAGGTLSPGAAGSTGILSLGGLSLDATGTTVISLADTGTTPGTDFDQVSILGSGSLGYGGTLNLAGSNIDSAVEGTTYQLFSFSGTPTGSFSSLTALGGNYAGITWSGPTGGVWTSTAGTGGSYLTFTEGTGTLAVVPEPSTFALVAFAGVAGLAAAIRRRKQSPSAA